MLTLGEALVHEDRNDTLLDGSRLFVLAPAQIPHDVLVQAHLCECPKTPSENYEKT